MRIGLRRIAKRLAPSRYHPRLRRMREGWRWLANRTVAGCFPRHYDRECPFCRWRFHRFLPGGIDAPVLREHHVIGGGYRQNMMCPYCESIDRERLIYLYLKTKTTVLSQSLSVLHVAPEECLQRVFLSRPNIQYVSADLESPLAMVRMDITRIHSAANTFDVIICNHVFEHVRDDRRAMAELLRVLKPGGFAILQVPLSLTASATIEDPKVTSPEERLRVFGQRDHVRLYASDYQDRLQTVGFSVELWSAADEYGERFVRTYCLLRKERLYIGRKPGS
jgi:SAM-dependent methyltransferase